jgi:hypothetical protein
MRANASIRVPASACASAARTTGRSPKAIGSSSPRTATSSTADRIACFEPNSRYAVAIGVLLSSAIASIVVAG